MNHVSVLRRGFARVIVAATFAGLELGAQMPASTPDPLLLAGCYRLTFGPHSDAFPARHLERRIWLTRTELGTEPGRPTSYVVRPAPSERASAFEAAFWTPRARGQELTLIWSTGFSGVTIDLAPRGGSAPPLTGEARTFTDMLGREPATAPATATPIECEP